MTDRKKVRFQALHKFFEKRNDHKPHDKYDKYILRCLVDLGEVYDENSDILRDLVRRGATTKETSLTQFQIDIKKQYDIYSRREKNLNDISHYFRKAIGL